MDDPTGRNLLRAFLDEQAGRKAAERALAGIVRIRHSGQRQHGDGTWYDCLCAAHEDARAALAVLPVDRVGVEPLGVRWAGDLAGRLRDAYEHVDAE